MVLSQSLEAELNRKCIFVVVAFLLVYLVALGMLLVGTLGLFSQEKDPLSGVFLIPLGLPWNMLFDSIPEPWLPWLGAGAPLLNLMLLVILCVLIQRRSVR